MSINIKSWLDVPILTSVLTIRPEGEDLNVVNVPAHAKTLEYFLADTRELHRGFAGSEAGFPPGRRTMRIIQVESRLFIR